jgi:sRNA-binding carbon storage regulator CsrA
VIGGGIVVVVKRIAGHRVTLGIEAPGTVKIVRGELPLFEAHHDETQPMVEADVITPTKPR